MVNSPHLIEDLNLSANEGKVDGINTGLVIRCPRAFKFNIADDNSTIQISNSLFSPELKSYFLSLQHWAQEVGDNKYMDGQFSPLLHPALGGGDTRR
jgi:hypothetical protein